jgi:methionyl-tRNA formyltransferase
MKLVFFGSSEFSVPSLEKLIHSCHEVLCVITQPDRKKGRRLRLESTPVKQYALKHNIKIMQPEKNTDNAFISFLRALNADIFIVIAYGHILTKEILSIPKIFCINVHASLLPKYRGAAPINWVIINGERTTGISIIRMNEFMDKGDIILQRSLNIGIEDTSISLSSNLAHMAAEMVIEVLDRIKDGRVNFTVQNDRDSTLAPKLKRQDGLIDWNKDAQSIYNQIRGMLPWPGTFTYYDNKLLKIWEAEIAKFDTKGVLPGTIIDVSKEYISVTTGKGVLNIKALQLESGKKMTAADFITGHKLTKGNKLG